MTTSEATSRSVLVEACTAAGFNVAHAEPVRLAENEIWRLPEDRVIVRIARTGQWAAAAREVAVAHWLGENEVPAVQALSIEQPVNAGDRPVTFWEELPPHRNGSVRDVAQLLKQLHRLSVPSSIQLGDLDPFVRIAERINAANTLSDEDREWLQQRHAELKEQWEQRPAGLPDCVVHGDAWVGNVADTVDGPVLLDFERVSVGPPEWDLVSTALKLTTTGTVTEAEYAEFCELYGTEVTQWQGYELLAGARELRMTTYAAQYAAAHPEWHAEAQYRVDCLRGRVAGRPWQWTGIM
ncbi:aminoglycoside phosphotransferase family protein [Streptomyces sp. NPDC007162]|uniref:phosphotransferase family protein n=1 Tax=Streptomyces sp. NPDC007162 TaxID=3156917 RepID=UPI003407E461